MITLCSFNGSLFCHLHRKDRYAICIQSNMPLQTVMQTRAALMLMVNGGQRTRTHPFEYAICNMQWWESFSICRIVSVLYVQCTRNNCKFGASKHENNEPTALLFYFIVRFFWDFIVVNQKSHTHTHNIQSWQKTLKAE